MVIIFCFDCGAKRELKVPKPSKDGKARCKRCIQKRSSKNYYSTEIGKQKLKLKKQRHEKTPSARLRQKRYRESKHGKEVRKLLNLKFRKSEKGKELARKRMKKRYWSNPDYYRLKGLSCFYKCEIGLLKEVKERDKICQFCGTDENLTFDHMHPVSRGGGTSLFNLQVLCLSCNSFKNDKLFTSGKYPAMVVGI